MFANFAYMGGFFLTPLLLEQVFRYGESAAGLLVIPRPLSFSLCSPIAGYVAVRVGERSAAVLGTIAVVASMGVFALTGRSTGVALVEMALVLSGIGMGVASPSIAASVANVVDQDALGTASATQQLATQIATVAGIQVLPDRPGVDCSWPYAGASAGVVSHRVHRRWVRRRPRGGVRRVRFTPPSVPHGPRRGGHAPAD